jgi:AcrR family transcriptional regulator
MTTRPYRQQLRAEAAEETRRRILDTLYDALRTAPAESISVDEVARRARVSRSTVYLAFGSRSGLYDAVTERLLQGAGYDLLMEAVRHPDARETLRGGIEGGARMYAAHLDVLRVLYATGRLDPNGAGRAIATSERKRYEGMGWLAGRLRDEGHLRVGVTVEDAAHLLWVQTSFDAFDLLATGRGLDVEEAIRILVETAGRALLGDAE